MNRKTISLIILLLMIAPIIPIPLVTADGASTTEEVWVEFKTGYEGQGIDDDGDDDAESATPASKCDLTSWDYDVLNITDVRAYIYNSGDVVDGRTYRIGIWEYISDTNAGYIFGYFEFTSDDIIYPPEWKGITGQGPITITDKVFFIGVWAENDANGVQVIYSANEGSLKSITNEYSFAGGDPFVETDSYSDRTYNIQFRGWVYKDKLTTYNQYFGDTENYTARRDVNYTFPSGVTNKKYRITIPLGEGLVNLTYSNGELWNQKLSSSDYDLVLNFNTTHQLITIENTVINLYGPAFRIFTQSQNYIYNIYGPFYENGTNIDNITLTATRADTSEEIELDGYYFYGNDEATIMFTWVLSGGETRRYYPIPITENIYIFEPEGVYATYGFDIRDYPGVIGTNVCFLEAVRSVNGTERVVERTLIWNTHSLVPMILTKNKVYLLRVILEDGSYYTFGYFTPGDYAPPTLSITGLGFSDYYQPVSKWVQMDISRPNATHIKMVYQDGLLLTVGVNAIIKYRNGTEVWSDYQSEDSYTFNWYGATNTTEYVAYLYANHGLYGYINASSTLMGAIDPYAPPDFSIIGVDPSLLSIFLILAVAGTVSRWNKVAGMFSASAIASMLTYIGWISIPYEALAAAFALTIIAGLGGR